MSPAARQALAALLASWRDWPDRRAWYLAEHIPALVAHGPHAGRTSDERTKLEALHTQLEEEEWEALGLLLVQADKRDQGLIAEFKAKANRDRARIAEEDQKARAAERRRQTDA